MLLNKERVEQILQTIIIIGLVIFTVAIPHSIAAAQIGYTLGCIALICKKLWTREFSFTKISIDWPMIGFIVLTILSTIFSLDRSTSVSKLRALTLLGIVYLITDGIPKDKTRKIAQVLVGLLIFSALTGVCWSFIEKIKGRGMIVTEIKSTSPIATSGLLVGDVIWLIGKEKISSLEDINNRIQKSSLGSILVFEALHEGDPLYIKLHVTEQLKNDSSSLGIVVGKGSSKFRVSGFTRHFGTYADQLLLFALLCLGFFIAQITSSGPLLQANNKVTGSLKNTYYIVTRRTSLLYAILFILFTTCILLTASRAVIAALIITMAGMMLTVLNKRIVAVVLPSLLITGLLGFFIVTTVRTAGQGDFTDDSTSRRISYMEAGLRVIPKYPIFGIGMDSQKTHWKELNFPGDHITHTHSTPIQLALDRGVPALLCYVWMIILMLITLRRGYKSNKGDSFVAGLNLGAFAAVAGFTLSSMVNYNFGDSEVLMVVMALFALAVTLHKGQSPQMSQDSATLLHRSASGS